MDFIIDIVISGGFYLPGTEEIPDFIPIFLINIVVPLAIFSVLYCAAQFISKIICNIFLKSMHHPFDTLSNVLFTWCTGESNKAFFLSKRWHNY